MVREQAIICTANGYIISLTFVSVWIVWLDVLLIINGYLLSLSVWCFQGTTDCCYSHQNPESLPNSDRCSTFLFLGSGGHLFSHTVSSAVPSAAYVLTVVFGMGTGVSHKRIATRNIRVIKVNAAWNITAWKACFSMQFIFKAYATQSRLRSSASKLHLRLPSSW